MLVYVHKVLILADLQKTQRNITHSGDNRPTKSNTPAATDPSRPNLDVNAPAFQSHRTLNLWVSSGTAVLLQTAQATILNPNQTQSRQIRMVFDTGSHQSFITES